MLSYHETESLILEIRKRKIIWDTASDEYKNKSLKYDAWTEVCTVLRPEYNDESDAMKKQILSDLQIRWKSIRDANNRSHKKMKRKYGSAERGSKKYVFADLLSFLQKTATNGNLDTDDSLETYSRIERSSTQNPQEDEEEQEVKPMNPGPVPSPTPIPRPVSSSTQPDDRHARKRSLETNIEERMIAFMDRHDDNDADKDFFNSLMPFVRALTEDQKLEFRSQIITLLQRIKSRRYVAPPEPFDEHA